MHVLAFQDTHDETKALQSVVGQLACKAQIQFSKGEWSQLWGSNTLIRETTNGT